LVAALATEHDLEMLCREARHDKLRKRSGPRYREIEVVDDIGDVVAEMLRRYIDRMQPRAGLVDGGLRKTAFVIARVIGEPPVEAIGEAARRLAGEDRDEAGIDAARSIGADRHIAAQMHIDRVVEQFGQPALEIALVVLEINIVADVP